MKKNWIRFSCMTLAVLLPLLIAVVSFFALPKIYDETFLGELADKYALLCDTDDPKIIVIGGSSVAFGLDSAALEEATGYKVVNFGLYATLGTKIMLDLSEANINSGDIIILAPELDSQTLSLYFNATSAWQGLEGDYSMLFHVGSDNISALIAHLPDYLSKRADALINGTTLSPTGVYRHDSFNEYGDICYARPYNVMTFQYDRTQTITLTPDIFDEDFIEYLNKYIDRAQHRGAEVYFTFCPMNESALDKDTTEESIQEFYDYVSETLHCEVISDPNDSIMDQGYFFDTNYHLNDAGVKVHTAHLAADILRTLGEPRTVLLDLPEPPGKKPADTTDDDVTVTEDPWEKYFTYEDFGGALRVTGTTEDAKYMTSLTVPSTANGLKVLVLGTDTFIDCKALQEITLGPELTVIENGAFGNCPTLLSINMQREDAESLEAGTDVFANSPDRQTIYLFTDTSFSNFTTGYWWGMYANRMERKQQ